MGTFASTTFKLKVRADEGEGDHSLFKNQRLREGVPTPQNEVYLPKCGSCCDDFGSNRRFLLCRCTESPPNGTVDAEGHENSHGPLGIEQIIGNGPARRHVPELVNTVAFSESALQEDV